MIWMGIKERLTVLISLMNKRSKRLYLHILLIFICGGCFGLVLSSLGPGSAYSKFDMNEIKITAHRGYSSLAPENTLPAFLLAVDYRADYVELDVQKTKDNVLVVFHDRTLKRMAGINKRINELTYAELQQIDVGTGYEEEFFGTSIPTLEEILQTCQGRVKFNIELKSSEEDLGKLVLHELEKYHLIEESVITSTNYHALKQIKQSHPNVMTGYILSVVYGDIERLKYADVLSIKSKQITTQLVQQVHQSGKLLYAWTVNDPAEIERLLHLGVDNIITDEVETVIQVRQCLLENI